MARKEVVINPKSGERLKEWLLDIKLSQAELAERINYSQQLISDIVRGKRSMTKEFAQAVRQNTYKPGYNIYGEEITQDSVRVQWLLGLDDYKTDEDSADGWHDRLNQTYINAWGVLEESAMRRGMHILINHPEGEHPDYVAQLHEKDRVFYTIEKNKIVVKKLSVMEFIELTRQLEEYADYLLWKLMPGGADNG